MSRRQEVRLTFRQDAPPLAVSVTATGPGEVAICRAASQLTLGTPIARRTAMNPDSAAFETATADDYWQRLMHRWFVQYNPIYLVSAALVLAGANLLSAGLARRGGVFSELGGAAVAALYAWSLLAACALLVRRGAVRPAVMLALLVVLFQCDVTLHTATSANLGATGLIASALWLGNGLVQLGVLAKTMRLAVSFSAWLTVGLGALGLAALPQALPHLDAGPASGLIGAWCFGLAMVASHTHRRVRSSRPLDDWGATVLRRSLRTSWLLWGGALSVHVGLWATDRGLRLQLLVPLALLLATRWTRSEAKTWLAVLAALGLGAGLLPEFFWMVAAASALTLWLRATRRPRRQEPSVEAGGRGPYRSSSPPPPARARIVFARAPLPAYRRLGFGALALSYVATWTFDWSGGPWPEHTLPSLLVFSLALLTLARAWRSRGALTLLVPAPVHWATQRGVLEAPASLAHWGGLAVGLGFALLAVGLVATLRAREPPEHSLG